MLRQVRAVIHNASGDPLVGAEVSITPKQNTWAFLGPAIAPRPIVATTDAQGKISLLLYQGSYDVTVTSDAEVLPTFPTEVPGEMFKEDPTLTVNAEVVGRVLNIELVEVGGEPYPNLELELLLGAEDVSIDALTSINPEGWSYTIPSSTEMQTVAYTVTASNGSGDDLVAVTETGSFNVAADIIPPSFLTQPDLPATIRSGDLVALDLGVADGAPTPSLTRHLSIDSIPQSNLGASIIAGPAGTVWSYWVTATNIGGTATSAIVSRTIQAALNEPSVDVSGSLPAVVRVGDTITPTAGILSGNPTPTVDSVTLEVGSSPVAIPYTVQPGDVGADITYTENITNGTINASGSVTRTIQVAAGSLAAPTIIGSIPALSVEQGTGVPDLDLLTVFDPGNPAATFSLVAPVDGISITGNLLVRDDSVVRVDAGYTVVATNSEGSVQVPSSFEVTAPASNNSYVASISNLTTVSDIATADLVFDSGAAFGRNQALIQRNGTSNAPDGFIVEGCAVDDVGTELTPYQDIGPVVGGIWNGTFDSARTGNAWRSIKVRVKNSDAVLLDTETTRWAVGHVTLYLGQSEIFRAMSYSDGYAGAMDQEQFQIVSGDFEFNGGTGSPGDPVTGFTRERGFLYPTSGIEPKATHSADFFQKHTSDKVMILVGAQSANGRNDLGNDSKLQRRWPDLISVLDGGGYQDGVRPGVIVDMWTNRDGDSNGGYSADLLKFLKPFYTGRNVDGTTYNLTDTYTVETFTGTPGTNDDTISWDHILFDLTTSGEGRGIFDEAHTKVVFCHHRYDTLINQQNSILDGHPFGGGMMGQELFRAALFGEVLSDPDIAQVAIRGTEPLNYKNGDETGAWGDWIHPSRTYEDGLALFARHLAHAACQGLGLTNTAIPEFDTIEVDPGGAWADISWSGGNITTTRKLRGIAELLDTQPHWTEVFGFEFNDHPVQRAEIVDGAGNPAASGKVRVYVPPGAGSRAGDSNLADWAKDRIHFGRGGGTGRLLAQEDSEAETWLNYPVADNAPAGLVDDQRVNSQQGVAVRPLPNLGSPEFVANTVVAPGSRFVATEGVADPAAANGNCTSFRFEFRGALHLSQEKTRLFSIGTRAQFFLSRGLNVRSEMWSGGGTTSSTSLDFTPGAMHDHVIECDMVARTINWWIDGIHVQTRTINGFQTKFVNGDAVSILGVSGDPDWTYDFQRAAVWLNFTTGTADPVDPGVTVPYKEILGSSGATALNSDAWKGGADLVPFDPGASAPNTPAAPPGSTLINSNAEFLTYLAEGKSDPNSKDGDEVVFAPHVEITVTGTDWQGGFNATTNKRIWRSLDPTQPAVFKEGMTIRPAFHGDNSDLGNMEIRDIVFDKSASVALLPPEQDNNQTDEVAISVAEGSGGNVVRDFEFRGLGFIGPFPNYLFVNQDAEKQVIGIQYYGWQGLTIEGCTWTRMSTGMQIGGHGLNIGRNRFKGNAEDFTRFSVARFNTTGTDVYDWTQDVVYVENVFGDANSRNRLHPDLIQFDEGYAGSPPAGLGIRRMTLRGNISYEGEALDCPIYPTATGGGFSAGGKYGANSGRVVSVMPAVPTNGLVYRLTDTAGGTYTLPDPALYSVGDGFTFQLEATTATYNTWTLEPPVGVTMSVNQGPASVASYDVVKKNMTVEFEVVSATEWQLIPKLPNNNMYQSNMTGSQGSFVDIAFVNLAHITQGSVAIRIEGNWQNVLVDGCLLARTLPGDRTGNGFANEFADGYFPQGNNPGIICRNGHNVLVRNNVATSINSTGGTGTNITTENNHIIDYSNEAALQALWPAITASGDGIAQFPTNEGEVVSLFRPGAGTGVDTNGQGPFRAIAANDPHPWAWVATHTAGPGQTNTGIDYTQATYPTAA